MPRLPLLLCTFLLALPAALSAQTQVQTRDYPEVKRFAQDITGIIWDLRGTSGLKHLRFDGTEVHELKPGDKPGGAYEHAFVDAGVLRLNFRGPNAGWYFISDDRKVITPLTIEGEVQLQLAAGSQPKPVVNFPQDITGAVWDTIPDERKLSPMRLRFNGSQLEIGVKRAEAWKVDKETPVVANRRVFEIPAPDGTAVWFVFSADGREAWMLQVQNVFGGWARNAEPKPGTAPRQTGLPPQWNDLANHAGELLAAGDQMRVDTLRRQLQRKLKAQPELAKAVDQRLGGK